MNIFVILAGAMVFLVILFFMCINALLRIDKNVKQMARLMKGIEMALRGDLKP